MIERVYSRYYAVCDICGEESPEFDDFYDCKVWVKENWRYHWDKNRNEWEILCDNCKSLK